MRPTFCKASIVMAIVLILVFALACMAGAASEYYSGLRVGSGNLAIYNGTFSIKDSNYVTKFTIAPATGNTTIAGTLAVTGASTIPIVPVVAQTTATRTVTSADFGKIIACSYAGATTITLPSPAAGIVGATLYITQLVDQTLTIAGGSVADNNAIIADGVLTSDSVAFSTAGHKIGAMARVTCISATKWLITNASACAMTVEAAD